MTNERFTAAFADFIKGNALDPNNFSLSSFPKIFIDYYREIRFEEYSNGDADEDVLFFQYGCYDWGKGRFFEIDFTRQYYKVFSEDGDNEVIQQQFKFYFDPAFFDAVQGYNVWSHNCDDLFGFESKITGSEGYLAALNREPMRFETQVVHAC
jgi:hypothetical protein